MIKAGIYMFIKYMEFLVKLKFMAGTRIEPLPLRSKECNALLTSGKMYIHALFRLPYALYLYACYTLAPISNVADLGIVKVLINVILSIRFRLKSF